MEEDSDDELAMPALLPDEPLTFAEALTCPNAEKWRQAALEECNELVFKSIGHYSSTPEHRTTCLMCSACSVVCFRFNQGTIDLCPLSVSPAHSLTSM